MADDALTLGAHLHSGGWGVADTGGAIRVPDSDSAPPKTPDYNFLEL